MDIVYGTYYKMINISQNMKNIFKSLVKLESRNSSSNSDKDTAFVRIKEEQMKNG